MRAARCCNGVRSDDMTDVTIAVIPRDRFSKTFWRALYR